MSEQSNTPKFFGALPVPIADGERSAQIEASVSRFEQRLNTLAGDNPKGVGARIEYASILIDCAEFSLFRQNAVAAFRGLLTILPEWDEQHLNENVQWSMISRG